MSNVVATFLDTENGLEARVVVGKDGWNVVLWDMDANAPVPIALTGFSSLAAALTKAKRLVED
jgi:hypothetical protein